MRYDRYDQHTALATVRAALGFTAYGAPRPDGFRYADGAVRVSPEDAQGAARKLVRITRVLENRKAARAAEKAAYDAPAARLERARAAERAAERTLCNAIDAHKAALAELLALEAELAGK